MYISHLVLKTKVVILPRTLRFQVIGWYGCVLSRSVAAVISVRYLLAFVMHTRIVFGVEVGNCANYRS